VTKPLPVLKKAEESSPAMSSTSAQRSRALDLLKTRGMLRLKDFVAEGIGAEMLARLVTLAPRAIYRPLNCLAG